MATDVELTVEDGIGWLTLRRPETRNAVDSDVLERRRPRFMAD
jgi:enoyl-CoA hydratase/carnithine racemase